jgi:hypothetical protein
MRSYPWAKPRLAQILSLRNERIEPVLLAMLVAAAFLVRIWGITRSHYWDEMVYLQNAQVICCGKINYSELDIRPPLISLLFAGVFLVWHSIWAASIATALVNALGPLFLYRAGRLAVGRVPAAIAALLLAFSPFFVGVFPQGFESDDTGNSLLTDSPALTLVLLAFWLLLRALARQNLLRFVWAGLALALTFLMRFGSLPSVGMLFLMPLGAARRWKALLACAAGFLCGVGPYLIWSRVTYGGFLATLRAARRAVEGPEEPFTFFLRNAATIFTPVALVGVAIAAGWLIWRLWRAAASREQIEAGGDSGIKPILIQGFLWLWLAGDFLFFSTMNHKEPRYVMPLAPPLLLLAGFGLALMCAWPRSKWRIAGGVIVGALLVVCFLPLRERFGEHFIDRNVQEEMLASVYLQTAVPPETVLYMNFNYPAFAYYTNYQIHELPAVGAALYSDIQQIPAGGVLVVYRETEGGEPDLRWVDANPHFERMRDFTTLVVFRRRGGE